MKKLSISIGEDVLGLVEAKKEKLGVDRSYVIGQTLETHFTLIKFMKKEIFQTFVNKELLLFADAANSTMFTARTIPYFPRMIEDAFKYEDIGLKWEVDEEELMKKLNQLSFAHYIAIIDFCDDFWADGKKNPFGDFYERIEKIKAL